MLIIFDMDTLIRVLEKTISSSQNDQNEAVRYIQEYVSKDFNGFLKALSDVLYDQNHQDVVRIAAGLQLKNQLTARDESNRQQQRDRWRRLPEETRLYIQGRVFHSLGTENFRPSSAPQCVAYIALAELSEKGWPTFIEALVRNAQNPIAPVKLKLATLEAIDYVCQEITSSEHQPNSRRREIINGLNASMNSIYGYIGDCIGSGDFDLINKSLQCLTGLLTWAQFNQDLIRFLCQLLSKYNSQPMQVTSSENTEQKLAILSSTCDCLNACLERKHSKIDSLDVRTCFFEDEHNLQAIIKTLDGLKNQSVQSDGGTVIEVMTKLSQVITNIMRYVYLHTRQMPQHLVDMYSTMKDIIAHPSIVLSHEGAKFWNKVFAVAPKKPNPSMSDELTAALLITCANKLISKLNYDIQLYGDFDCPQDFVNFQHRYRGELCELCRNLTVQNERICFELVSSSIAKCIQQRNTNINEWDALASLASAVCNKLKDRAIYVSSGVELVKALMLSMDSALTQASNIDPNATGPSASLIPDLISNQLSCVSALYVFLPYWHQTDKELTKELLNKTIYYAFHRPDKFITSSRQIVGNNTSLLDNEEFLKGFRLLARHASASFVRVCLNHSKHLLDIFSYLKSSIDLLVSTVVDNPYSSEKCQLYEGLTLICNEEADELARKKFIVELFDSIKWFKDYELDCDQFIEFVGFNRLEAEQDGLSHQNLISQPIQTSQLNRVKLNYVINFICAITKRLNSRQTLLPEVLSFARPILNIMFTMHALWLPEMKAKCVKEYQQFLFAPFNNAYKQQILETILVNQKSNGAASGDSNAGDSSSFGGIALGDTSTRPAKGNGQYIELFSWNFYECVLNTLGALINKTTPELFNYLNQVHLQTALTGAEYLPPLKMHKLLKQFIMPLVTNCSKDQHLIDNHLLPLLSKLLPFLFRMLDTQWKKYLNDDEPITNGDSNTDQNQVLADEMVQDHLLRNLSRDFIDLMNLILVEATTPAETTVNQNHNSINNCAQHNQNQNPGGRNDPQDLHKISKLGLHLLAAGPDFILEVMASTLTWQDSTLNAKAIFINQQLIRHLIATNTDKGIDGTSQWLGCMFGNVITSLRMFGEHEQNCSGLLTLFLYLYDNLSKSIPSFHDHLERMTGIAKVNFIRYDQEDAKSNEKTKRAGLRKILDSLVGRN